MPLVAREPAMRTLAMRKDLRSNPKIALEIFLDVLGRQRERGNLVGNPDVAKADPDAKAIQTYKIQY